MKRGSRPPPEANNCAISRSKFFSTSTFKYMVLFGGIEGDAKPVAATELAAGAGPDLKLRKAGETKG